MLFIVNGKIYCTYIITKPMGGDEIVKRRKLNRTQVITSYSFCFDIQTKHINTCVC